MLVRDSSCQPRTIEEKLECSCFCPLGVLRTQLGLLALRIDGFLQLPPERKGKRGWHSVANLPVLALNGARKLVAVRKALQTLIGSNALTTIFNTFEAICYQMGMDVEQLKLT